LPKIHHIAKNAQTLNINAAAIEAAQKIQKPVEHFIFILQQTKTL